MKKVPLSSLLSPEMYILENFPEEKKKHILMLTSCKKRSFFVVSRKYFLKVAVPFVLLCILALPLYRESHRGSGEVDFVYPIESDEKGDIAAVLDAQESIEITSFVEQDQDNFDEKTELRTGPFGNKSEVLPVISVRKPANDEVYQEEIVSENLDQGLDSPDEVPSQASYKIRTMDENPDAIVNSELVNAEQIESVSAAEPFQDEKTVSPWYSSPKLVLDSGQRLKLHLALAGDVFGLNTQSLHVVCQNISGEVVFDQYHSVGVVNQGDTFYEMSFEVSEAVFAFGAEYSCLVENYLEYKKLGLP